MVRPEYRRSGVNDHIHTGVDDLLICIKADEAVLVGYFLAKFLRSHFPEAFEPVRENVAESGQLYSVSRIKQVLDGTGAASSATDYSDLYFLAGYGLVREFRNVVILRFPERDILRSLAGGSEGLHAHNAAYSQDCGSLEEVSSVHLVLFHSCNVIIYISVIQGFPAPHTQP